VLPLKVKNELKTVPNQVPDKDTEKIPKEFILAALEQSASDDAGWTQLGTFGSYINKLQPDFDSRRYGYKKLSDLVKAKSELFEIEERSVEGANQKILYLRAKKNLLSTDN
jgi:hypothetical protein